MTWARMATEANTTEMPERTEREVAWPWHELEYALLETDSDRILAEALTPQAVVLLTRVATDRDDRSRSSSPTSVLWSSPAAPAPEIRAKQRSPPVRETE